ncbi:MAG: hypothetical protein K2X39_10070, partial [Silvanigrellaceae bacterium]|nr:hypothetical protein [Silvanigrellaceae bacterium]
SLEDAKSTRENINQTFSQEKLDSLKLSGGGEDDKEGGGGAPATHASPNEDSNKGNEDEGGDDAAINNLKKLNSFTHQGELIPTLVLGVGGNYFQDNDDTYGGYALDLKGLFPIFLFAENASLVVGSGFSFSSTLSKTIYLSSTKSLNLNTMFNFLMLGAELGVELDPADRWRLITTFGYDYSFLNKVNGRLMFGPYVVRGQPNVSLNYRFGINIYAIYQFSYQVGIGGQFSLYRGYYKSNASLAVPTQTGYNYESAHVAKSYMQGTASMLISFEF